MINLIIDQALAGFSLSSVFTRRGGLVITHEEKNGSVLKKIPALANPGADSCEEGSYISMEPDSSENGTLYFELISQRPAQEVMPNLFTEEALVRCICHWKLGTVEPQNPEQLMSNVVKEFPKRQANIGTWLTNIRFHYTGLEPKSTNLFAKYSYDLTETQYLMPPFHAMGINFKINWNSNPFCTPVSTHVPNACI